MSRRLILLLVLVISCTEEEVVVPVYPRMITESAVADATGVTFKALVSDPGNQSIIGHGFQWGTKTPTQGISASDKIELGTFQGTQFEKHVTYGFTSGSSYVVRAFVRTANATIYGELVEFVGGGTVAPVIKSITPALGTWLDTLVIKGQNFTYNPAAVKIEFSKEPGTVLASTDTTIKVIVPANFTDKPSTALIITTGGYKQTSPMVFTLRPPQITSITPAQGFSNTTVTIKGKYFHPSVNAATIGETPLPNAEVISATEIRFKPPKALPKGSFSIKVTSAQNTVDFKNGFKRLGPEIQSVSPTLVFAGDAITIKGENFGTPFTDNQVVPIPNAYDDIQILETKPGELKIGFTTIYGKGNKLVVYADGVSDTTSVAIDARPPVLTSASATTAIWPGQMVTVNGNYFAQYTDASTVMFGDKAGTTEATETTKIEVKAPIFNDHTLQLKVDVVGQTTPTSIAITSPLAASFVPGDARDGAGAFGIGTKGYIVGGESAQSGHDVKVYAFDETTKVWTQKNDFPGGERRDAATFVLNGKGYVFGGGMPGSSDTYGLWEYEPSNDSWTRKSVAVPFVGVAAYNVSGQIYGVGDQAFWKYNPVDGSWAQIAAPPDGYDFLGSSFAIPFGSNLVFIITESSSSVHVREYNTSLNQWTDKGATSMSLDNPFGFEYNSKALVISNENIYQYNPANNSWATIKTNLYPVWLGGRPTIFKTTNKTHFGLFALNIFNSSTNPDLKNLFYSFDGQYSGL